MASSPDPSLQRITAAPTNMLAAQAPATHHAASPVQASAGSRVPSIRNVLTSGQHDVDVSVSPGSVCSSLLQCPLADRFLPQRLTPYSEMPKHIPDSAPTIWRAEDYRGDANRHKWIRIWTAQEIEWLETAAKAWKASGRSLTEIERVRGAEGAATQRLADLACRRPSTCRPSWRRT